MTNLANFKVNSSKSPSDYQLYSDYFAGGKNFEAMDDQHHDKSQTNPLKKKLVFTNKSSQGGLPVDASDVFCVFLQKNQ